MQTEEHVGRVMEYRSTVKTAAIHVDREHLEIGDVVHFRGEGIDHEEPVTSLRQNREPVQAVHTGQDADMVVQEPVPEGTEVLRVKDPYEDSQAELLGGFFGRTGPTGEGSGQGETF